MVNEEQSNQIRNISANLLTRYRRPFINAGKTAVLDEVSKKEHLDRYDDAISPVFANEIAFFNGLPSTLPDVSEKIPSTGNKIPPPVPPKPKKMEESESLLLREIKVQIAKMKKEKPQFFVVNQLQNQQESSPKIVECTLKT